MYISVKQKFLMSLTFSFIWAGFSFWVAQFWIDQLADSVGIVLSYIIVFGIAIIPGWMNSFLVASLLLDKRPPRHAAISNYPAISILVAAYNEEAAIQSTVESLVLQHYPGVMNIFIVNDGSTDDTLSIATDLATAYNSVEVIDIGKNVGKANALTSALAHVQTDITITVDGDCYLYGNALTHLVERYLSDPDHTAAVAGAILARNSRDNFLTKVQEWDYFHGISAVKRLQSLYQGTLVAQGAFSLYKTDVLKQLGGWPHAVGEDIVLTWNILGLGYRVGYAEDACCFTNVPDNLKQFAGQRQRWSRGLIEAFKAHWELLFKPRMTTIFVWWNLMFPYMDVVFTFVFIPGIIMALFGNYTIVGLMTLILLPMALSVNYLLYRINSKMFEEQGLRVRKNFIGFVTYAMFYSLFLQPICVMGYFKEVFYGRIKNWGTK